MQELPKSQSASSATDNLRAVAPEASPAPRWPQWVLSPWQGALDGESDFPQAPLQVSPPDLEQSP